MGVEVRTLAVGPLAVNCYLVWDGAARRAVVIDPGDEAEAIVDALAGAGLEAAAVLLTHAHVDHLRGVAGVAARWGAPVYVHRADRALYRSPLNALQPWLPAAEGLPEPVTELPDCGGLEVVVLHTPGHTPGGVCFHLPKQRLVFSGDTLFRGGVGRTDLPGGNLEDLERSVRTVLYRLPPETRVLPGHGDPTTIGEERSSNPFVRA